MKVETLSEGGAVAMVIGAVVPVGKALSVALITGCCAVLYRVKELLVVPVPLVKVTEREVGTTAAGPATGVVRAFALLVKVTVFEPV